MSLQINNSYANLGADYRQAENSKADRTPAENPKADRIQTGTPKADRVQERTPKADRTPAGQKEKCTTDTDQVDREIRQLREKKKQLEQQLERAVGDEKKCRELEKQLAQINAELAHKDNDTYRRQHAHTSM